MNARRKIEKFCLENSIRIIALEYDRYGQHIYGDYSNESEWILECEINGENDCFCGYAADELIDKIKRVLEEI